MKTLKIIFILTLCLQVFGQGKAPKTKSSNSADKSSVPLADQGMGASNTSSGGNSSIVSSGGSFWESQTAEKTGDKIFDTNTDSIDFENGTLNWKGKTFNIGNSRLVRARFERYLATDMSDKNFANYQMILGEIVNALSVSNENVSEQTMRDAWKRLFDAAAYDIDNDSSLMIANTVYASWRMRSEYFKTNLDYLAANEELRKNKFSYEGDMKLKKYERESMEMGTSSYERELRELRYGSSSQKNNKKNNQQSTNNQQTNNTGQTSNTQQSGNSGQSQTSNGGKSDISIDLAGMGSASMTNVGGAMPNNASGNSSTPDVGSLISMASSGALLADSVSSAAEEKVLNKLKRESIAAQTVLQFQSQIVLFLLNRKFQHAIISAEFYRHIYRASKSQLNVGQKELATFFPVSNFSATNDSLENLAIEARNDVKEGMAAVNTLYDAGERYGALQRLMETFVLGEYEPVVRSLDFGKKKILHQLYKELSALKDLADNKDLVGIEQVLERLKKIASDFPYQETLSKVKTGQRASNLKVMQAKALAASGDLDGAKTALDEAASFWPLNPSIENFANEAASLSEGADKYTKRFDELFERENWREIMNEAGEYGIAFRADKDRATQLKDIVGKISQVDLLVAQAAEFEAQKNYYFAWEMLEAAKRIESKDPKLAFAMSNLAPFVADYVKALNMAKQSELKGDWSAALTHYINAQDIFPASQSCRLGIESMSRKILTPEIKAEPSDE